MAKQTYSEKLKDPLWLMKRRSILARDNFTCQSCGDKEKVMNVHHEYYITGNEPWEYPDKALVTLCQDCHAIEENGRKEAFRMLNTSIADAGFTREDVIKLSTVFNEIQTKPIYSYLLMSAIYRGIWQAYHNFEPGHYQELKTEEETYLRENGDPRF